jgi:lichenan operon transcriptional antiterminator
MFQKSTLAIDFKDLENILSKYSLRLIKSKGYIYIDGLERINGFV